MRWFFVSLMLLLPMALGLLRAQPAAENDLATDRRLLETQGLSSKGPALLAFFRKHTPTAIQQEDLKNQVLQLGSTTYSLRERAETTLVAAGDPARPFLLDAVKNSDLEIARRAELCLRRLGPSKLSATLAAAAHLLAHEKPAGAAEVLLRFLPFAPDLVVAEEIQDALPAVVVRDGKVEPAVLKALTDPRPTQRAASGSALARAGNPEQLIAVRPLLEDPAPEVRLVVARALAQVRQRDAIPVLINLLAELPPDQTWQVEEILNVLAGENAPSPEAGPQTKLRDTWRDWWQSHGNNSDLKVLSEGPRLLGYTLVTQMTNGAGNNGCVREIRPNQQIVWEIQGLRYPVDAQVIGRDRVLVAEYLNRSVTERDFEGKIHWQHQVDMPIACQRLPNGHTFIASRRSLLIVDKTGRELFTYHHPSLSIAAGRRLPDGQMVLVTSTGQLVRLNPQGQEIQSFKVGFLYTMGANIDVLPGGRVLIPQYRDNKVVEYDAQGKSVWEANVTFPTSAVRLPNGHTLAVSMSQNKVVELARDGKELWTYQTDGRPWRARRR